MKQKNLKEVLSDIIIYKNYARYLPELKRRETWEEVVERNRTMHERNYPKLKKEIQEIWNNYVLTKKILPSMRSLQFSGPAIENNPAMGYNCCFLHVDCMDAFGETAFLLLSGCGVGFSVQKHHVDKIPSVLPTTEYSSNIFVVEDTREGWADAFKHAIASYIIIGKKPLFDYSKIRPEGAPLKTTGGKAPGPEPLKRSINKIVELLNSIPENTKLKPINVHDIICHIADACSAGGIRRSALISLFDMNDDEMLKCKTGEFWNTNPQRARANNSAVLERTISNKQFARLWNQIEQSGTGEPGLYLTNNKEWGTNPCCFTKETQIETRDGNYPIYFLAELIKLGITPPDIWSYNIENGQKELKPCITGQLTKEKTQVIEIVFEKGSVKCTPDHPFYVQKEWITADKLQIGSECVYHELDENQKTIETVCKVTEIKKDIEPEDVYDIQVEGNSNFYANGILVHNCEIALRNMQFCNLTEVNVTDITSQQDLNERIKAAAFIGTLQAGNPYTRFKYLRPEWKKVTEEDRLIGVGLTGIASGAVLKYDLKEAAEIVKKENKRVADILGINPAARTTTVKPSGCLDYETVIKTNIGNKTLLEIFELNGYKYEDLLKIEQQFLPLKEKIWIYNSLNEMELVSNLFVNGIPSDLIEIQLEDDTIIKCTLNHKFLTEQDGWVEAQDLLESHTILSY